MTVVLDAAIEDGTTVLRVELGLLIEVSIIGGA
jgi:hypothetical protein